MSYPHTDLGDNTLVHISLQGFIVYPVWDINFPKVTLLTVWEDIKLI